MKIGVIGLGSIGIRHSRNVSGLGYEVIGFDPDSERRAVAAQLGIETTDQENFVFNNCGAVIICSPNKFHLYHLRMAVSHACHALIEKPLSHTLDGLKDCLDESFKKNLIIGLAMNLRFHPVAKEVKSLLAGEIYGEPLWARFTMSSYLPDWRPHQDYRTGYTSDVDSGGVLFDIIHEPDLAQFLLGPASVVTASAHNSGMLDIKSEDCADIVLDHGKFRSSIHMDYISKHKRRYFEIQCEEGFLFGDLNARTLKQVSHKGEAEVNNAFAGGYDDDYLAEVKNFLGAVSGTEEYFCPADQAYDVLAGVIYARKLAGL